MRRTDSRFTYTSLSVEFTFRVSPIAWSFTCAVLYSYRSPISSTFISTLLRVLVEVYDHLCNNIFYSTGFDLLFKLYSDLITLLINAIHCRQSLLFLGQQDFGCSNMFVFRLMCFQDYDRKLG